MNPQVNSSLKKLDKLSKDLVTNLEVVGKYTYEKLESVLVAIDAKTEELSDLQKVYNEKKREADVNLTLQMRADAETTVRAWANSSKHILVSNTMWADMEEALANADADKNKAVAIATSSLKKTMEMEFQTRDNVNQISTARMEAELDQMRNQNAFLNTEINRLTNELKAAGDRIVAVAEANNSSTVNVSK